MEEKKLKKKKKEKQKKMKKKKKKKKKMKKQKKRINIQQSWVQNGKNDDGKKRGKTSEQKSNFRFEIFALFLWASANFFHRHFFHCPL